MYSDRQARENSVDLDEMLHSAASHLGLHCLPLIQPCLDTKSGSKLYFFKSVASHLGLHYFFKHVCLNTYGKYVSSLLTRL